MQYMLLIYENEAGFLNLPEAELGTLMGEYRAFTEDIARAGHFQAGHQLQPVATATTVRVKGGTVQTTDGPFAETREQLGGYYLIEARDLDEAIALAARIPAARTGSVEVRPIVPSMVPAQS